MSKWEKVKLGDKFDIVIGGTPSRANLNYWDVNNLTENHWVSIKDLSQKIIYTTSEKISNLGINHSNAKLIKKNSLLMSFKLTIGKLGFAGVDLYTNEAIAALLPKCDMEILFIYYGLQYWDLLKDIDQAIKGATLNKSKLKEIEIFLPPLPIQTRIAEILSTADKAIEDSEKLIAKYKRMKTGMMQDLLTKGIDENGNIRSETTHKFKDSPLGRIPVEWEVKRLEEVVNVRVSNVDKKSVEGERRVLLCNYMDVYSNRFIKQHNSYMEATASKSQIERFILEKNDVIITKDSETPDDIGVPAVVFEELTNVICGYHLALLKPKHNIDGIYLMYMLQHPFINKYLALNATGVTRFGLRISTIENTLILLPNIIEQKNISEKIVEIEKNIEIETQTLSKLKRLKTGLMNDLLSGKVEVVKSGELKVDN
jgi:type I restriction enzyme S subunit